LHTTRVCPVPSHASCPHARGLRSKLNRRQRLKNHGNRPNQIRWVEKITSWRLRKRTFSILQTAQICNQIANVLIGELFAERRHFPFDSIANAPGDPFIRFLYSMQIRPFVAAGFFTMAMSAVLQEQSATSIWPIRGGNCFPSGICR